jgi:hypothetical protein
MPLVRFRLRSLMILVLISALGLAAFTQGSKVKAIYDWKPKLIILGSFLIVVLAKLGLLIGMRMARGQPDVSDDRGPTANSTVEPT